MARPNVFQQLTRLFRSGPVQRRKVRNLDTTIVGDVTDLSSAKMLMKRTHVNTYSTLVNPSNSGERLARYQEFVDMELTPELAAALDLFADEVVSPDEKNRVLHVYSDDEAIRSELFELFYGTLNIEFALRHWVRNVCKFGDAWLLIDVSPNDGVVGVLTLPVNEVEREEGFDPNDPFAIRFKWSSRPERYLENWEVAHFRLLGNDAFLPYGTSVLDPARRVWRQLVLAEDAMLIYRVTRAPERRVHYIDVGNLAGSELEAFMEEQKRTIRTSQVADSATGRIDLRYNPYCISLRSFIKLQDGRTLTLQELIDEWESGRQDQWVHSIDVDGKRQVPGKIVWAGVTRRDADMIRVHVDDETTFDVTPDHRFMLRDGTYRKAEDLLRGDALMPLTASGYSLNAFRSRFMPGNAKHTSYKSHTVVCVERLMHREDTGCITVEGWHNFAILGTTSVGTPSSSGVIVHNSIEEDYWLPVRGTESATRIDTLKGGENIAAVEDVVYFRDKMFTAIKVPKAYLNYVDNGGSKASLAQLDIRFSRTIQSIQKMIVSELNKIAITHLYARGFQGDDLLNFTLKLSNPSTVATQQKLELWRTRLEIAGLAADQPAASRRFIRQDIWGLSDVECRQIDNDRYEEKIIDMSIDDASPEASASSSSGASGTTSTEEPSDVDLDLGDGETPEDDVGSEPEGENEDETETAGASHDGSLIVAARDHDEDVSLDELKAKIDVENLPSRVAKHILYNRSRRRHSGAEKTQTPDFNRMTSGTDTPAVNDPYDSTWLKSVTTNPLADDVKPMLTGDMRRILEGFDAYYGISQREKNQSSSVLTEGSTQLELQLEDTNNVKDYMIEVIDVDE